MSDEFNIEFASRPQPCPHCDDEGWIYWTATIAVPDPSDLTGNTPMPWPEERRDYCICKAGDVPDDSVVTNSDDLPF